MKQTNLLKTFLLLCALIVGSTCAWADTTKTFDFSFTTIGTEGWTNSYADHEYSYTEGTVYFNASKQTGTITDIPVTKGKPVNFVMEDGYTISAVTFTCRQWGSKAQTITLKYSTDSGSTYSTLSPSVTSTDFSISSSSLPEGTNAVQITFSSTSNQVGVESVELTYSTSGSSDPSISADNVNIAYDATNGSIGYTLQNGTGNVTANVTNGDWLTLGTITSSEVPFTCSANPSTTARTAEVTLSFTGATDKVVTITQAGDPNAALENIAALTGKAAGTYKVALTNALVTYIKGSNAYIEDASGAVLLYGCANSIDGLAVGDKYNGTANVTYTVYKNLPEVTAISLEEGYTKTTGNTVTPVTITIEDLVADYTNFISRYIKIENATVTSAFSNKDCTIEQNGNSIILRDQNGTATLTSTKDDIVTVTGHPAIYNSTKQIALYEQSQIVVSAQPSITITADDPVNVDATSDSGEFPLTYANLTISAADDFAVQYYNSNDEEISEPAWITVAVEAATPSGYKVSYAVDDNDGEARSAYFKVWALDGSTLVYSNKVTITQAAYVAPAAPGNWAKATAGLADINSNDVFVIVGNDGDTYAMTNDNGTSAPEAAEVTVVNNTLSGTIAANLQWNLGSDKDGYIFYPNGSTTTWLYCTNSNNGVKVGTGAAKHFTLSEEGYLTTTETTDQRYIGIYNSQDWRCYTGTTGNIAGQTFAFYKKLAAKLNAYGYATFSSTVPVDFSQASDFTAWIITKIEGGTITFSQVTGSVPAGTGVLLKGTADQTVEFVATASGTALADNKFVGITTATAVTADTYFGLSGNKFVKVGAGTIKAGKALLPATEVSGARELTFVFDDATGIKQVESSKMNVEDIYNLNGQKVQNPTKGLYIMNGKKVIIK